jgi:hypothetical protein
VFEVTIAMATRPGLVDDITIDLDWAVITRGPAPIPDPETFALRPLLAARGRRLLGLEG